MAGEVVERDKGGGKKGLRRKKRRVSIRIDMTPMVDIAFLLLIFYMVSTVFAMPQAMEINLPPADQVDPVEIRESNLLTVRVDPDGRYWWHLKAATPTNLPILLPTNPDKPDTVAYEFWPDTLRKVLVNENRANPRLNTLILISPDAHYEDMVNILDEIDLIERSFNAYTMEELGVDNKQDIPEDRRFSYRYAMGEWEDRDDKILEAAIAAAQAEGKL